MKLCSYVVVHDTGFAPNPFGTVCTLAACTPNHQGIRLRPGDWLLGNSTAATGNLLVYAMRVAEVLDFDAYFRDPRYQGKKPRAADWQSRCGDNIYFLDQAGEWKQGPAYFHTEPGRPARDTKHPRVFISDHFFYFGEAAPPIPAEFGSLVQRRQGCRCNHPAPVAAEFVDWLETTYRLGRHGLPRDRPDRNAASSSKFVRLGI